MKPKNQTTTTPQQPETTPGRIIAPGSDAWMMLQIGELSGNLKALDQSVRHLCEKIDRLEASHETLSGKVSGIEKKIYAATAIMVLLVGVAGFIVNKAVDFGLDMAKESARTNNLALEQRNNYAEARPGTGQTSDGSKK